MGEQETLKVDQLFCQVAVSSLMQDLFDAIKGYGYEQAQHILADVEKKVLRLQRSFSEARNMLDKLEGEELVNNSTVRKWAEHVMTAIYDFEDLAAVVSLKIRDRDKKSFWPSLQNWGLSRHMDRLQTTLDVLLTQNVTFVPNEMPIPSINLSVNDDATFFRKHEKDEMIRILTDSSSSSTAACENVIISIQGELGIGKTTLAHHIKNDIRINGYFDNKFWVEVSGDFDVSKVLGSIITEAAGKRVLVILDDLYKIRDPEDWKKFQCNLLDSTSKFGVLITTRNHQVTKTITRYSTVRVVAQHLTLMSEEDCQSLILSRTTPSYSSTVAEKRKRCCQEELALLISEKLCNGSPLVANIIGLYLSSTSRTNEHWYSCLSVNDLWDVPGFGRLIIPTFKLDFSHLPKGIRNCFQYLSLFPIGYDLNKKDLVQYWKAEGFIAQGMPMEHHSPLVLEDDTGDDWFEELSSRSILIYDPEQENYRINEIVHKYATYLSCNICVQLVCNISQLTPDFVLVGIRPAK